MTTRERDWFYATSAVMVVSVLLAIWGWRYDPTGDRFPRWVTTIIVLISSSNGWAWLHLAVKRIEEKKEH
jgi:hypothetical protein